LPAITLPVPSPASDRPIVFDDEEMMNTPCAWFGISVVPLLAVPMKFPRSSVPLDPALRTTPLLPLPDNTLP
jgi:hypothetical protein